MPAVRKEKVRMKEIAEAAGVSVMTVSAALTGGGRISTTRREEIVALANRMGYRNNAAARLLKSKRIEDLGLLIFETEKMIRENASFMDMNVQFQKECLRNGLQFQIEWFDCHKNSDAVPQLLTSGLVGGLLIGGVPSNASKAFIDNELDLPFVTLDEPGRYSVRYDYSEQLRQALYYLVLLGHTRIGLINGPEANNVFRNARQVFDATLAELSLMNEEVFHIQNYPALDFVEQTTKHLEAYLNAPARPTALLIHSGLFVKGFISGLYQRGIRVPEDVSIICFETVDWEVERFFPPITAVERNLEDLVSAGIRMVRELMSGREPQRPQLFVPQIFTKRGTVAAPKKAGLRK